jgi:hypothetical protein
MCALPRDSTQIEANTPSAGASRSAGAGASSLGSVGQSLLPTQLSPTRLGPRQSSFGSSAPDATLSPSVTNVSAPQTDPSEGKTALALDS